MTVKLLPQKKVIRSSQASRRENERRTAETCRLQVRAEAKTAPEPGNRTRCDSCDTAPDRPEADASVLADLRRAERREEQQDQRDEQHVNDERLDQHEAQQQVGADVVARAGIARDGFHRGGHGLALAEGAEPGRDARARSRR